MSLVSCLKKMGFSAAEAKLILDESKGSDARKIVEDQIRALEAERQDILSQAAKPVEAKAEKVENAAELSARQIAESTPDMVVRDEAGRDVSVSDLLKEAAATFQQDVKDAGSFMAAVTCFLKG